MLGYVTIEKNELKIREYDIYTAYYCGICKSIGRRYGHLPRFVLNYDSVFLALILNCIDDKPNVIDKEHCIIHHIKKKTVLKEDRAVDFAADVMLLLAYYKFIDDLRDEKGIKKIRGYLGKIAFRKHYKALSKEYEQISGNIESQLKKLNELEAKDEKDPNVLVKSCDCFGSIMEMIFSGFNESSQDNKRILGIIGKNLGRWIYLIDAMDDYSQDIEKNRYNPIAEEKKTLLSGREQQTLFWEKYTKLLYYYLEEVLKAYDLLKITKNKGILDNIILIGLRGRTESIIERNKQYE